MKRIAIAAVLMLLAGCCGMLGVNPICNDLQPEVDSHFGQGFTQSIGGPEIRIENTSAGSCTYSKVQNELRGLRVDYLKSQDYANERAGEMHGGIYDSNEYDIWNVTSQKIVDREGYSYGYVYGDCESGSRGSTPIDCQNLILRKGSVRVVVSINAPSPDEFYTESTLLDFALKASDRAERSGT